ncbi:DNA-binding NarL/FixJ family response regulator [Catenuloplanes nepalensis]|uniref:DNA-binding NarL/FixJ family response regulator n=1 Tax=Catenuloplanes nepalensis TaxID=587533 RepID=A0ABT9MVU1_9ACTN|nr:response regulator transcription factor [Catenuloplanes nepalensis]MDP9795495.1 DNA-binding NarL/FixJ family response regulator [Catenuloplanes nepalensis]
MSVDAITVLVADDQAIVRRGLRLLLDSHPDITVVAEAEDGVVAIEAARRLRPDVCLVDIQMPRLTGLDVTRALAATMKVVVITTFDLDEYVHEALRAGAVGFILKDSGPALLAEAVRAAHAGDALVSPSVTMRLLRHFAGAGPAFAPGPPPPLTDRELELVRRVARGRTNREIAAELFVSVSTVKAHLANIQTKLGLRNRVEVAAWAWENHRT